jgi:hypothetical protein
MGTWAGTRPLQRSGLPLPVLTGPETTATVVRDFAVAKGASTGLTDSPPCALTLQLLVDTLAVGN